MVAGFSADRLQTIPHQGRKDHKKDGEVLAFVGLAVLRRTCTHGYHGHWSCRRVFSLSHSRGAAVPVCRTMSDNIPTSPCTCHCSAFCKPGETLRTSGAIRWRCVQRLLSYFQKYKTRYCNEPSRTSQYQEYILPYSTLTTL